MEIPYTASVRPDTGVLIMSGYAGRPGAVSDSDDLPLVHLQKPFTLEALTERVRRALREGRSERTH